MPRPGNAPPQSLAGSFFLPTSVLEVKPAFFADAHVKPMRKPIAWPQFDARATPI